MINRLMKHFRKVFKNSTREEVLEAVKKDGLALKHFSKHVSEWWQGDKEIVLEAVKQNGHALKYASWYLKGDKEVVMEAVKQDYRAVNLANERLKKDMLIFLIQAMEMFTFYETKNDK